MKYQIKSFSGHQSSKVIALGLAVFTLPFVLAGIIGFLTAEPMTTQDGKEVTFPWLFFVFAPLLYGLFGYIFNRFLFWAYNLLAKFTGGIEFSLEEQHEP